MLDSQFSAKSYGGRAPLKVFADFRGREPSPKALLRHNGLLPAAAA